MKASGLDEEAVFLEAIALPPSERLSYLDKTCGENAALRRRIEALLRADADPLPIFDQPVIASLREIAHRPGDDAEVERPGHLIHCYRIVEKIGEGGWGVVYSAEQTAPVRRRVALKLIKLGMDSRAVIARFEAERQALAMMEHPNIARVLDAGMTERGRLYFVMELVRGQRITDYCDTACLTIDDRLQLFVQICSAIQHAHQKGIIHRDIKPSNILVAQTCDGTATALPKVIDFGIAKATQGRLTDHTLRTGLDGCMGTPAYMSPEQLDAVDGDVDTRTDVYSLGVLLYELLTGRTPFDVTAIQSTSFAQWRRLIHEVESMRPSRRVSSLSPCDRTQVETHRGAKPAELSLLLRGDLDAIVMACLEKDRSRRYATASELAADVGRYLRHEVVTAHPPSNLYALRKIVRRHRLSVAIGSTAALAIFVAIGLSSWALWREREANRKSEASQARAEDLIDLLLADVRPALEQHSRIPVLRGFAEKLIRHYEAAPDHGGDAIYAAKRSAALGVLAYASNRMGEIQYSIGIAREAADWRYRALESDYEPATFKRIYALVGQQPVLLMYFHSLARPEDKRRMERCIQRLRQLRELHPEDHLLAEQLGSELSSLGWYRSTLEADGRGGLEALVEAAQLLSNAVAAQPHDAFLRVRLGVALAGQSDAYARIPDHPRALATAEQLVKFFAAACETEPGNLLYLEKLAWAARAVSWRAANTSFRQAKDAEIIAREHSLRLSEADPSNLGWRTYYAFAHEREVWWLLSENRFAVAEAAITHLIHLLEPLELFPRDQKLAAKLEYHGAFASAAQGDLKAARRKLRKADEWLLSLEKSTMPETVADDDVRLHKLAGAGIVLSEIGDWQELEVYARAALAASAGGPDDHRGQPPHRTLRAMALRFLGLGYLRRHQPELAMPLLRESVAILGESRAERIGPRVRQQELVDSWETFGEALAAAGQAVEARTVIEQALAFREQALQREPERADLRVAFARAACLLADLIEPSWPEDSHVSAKLRQRARARMDELAAEDRLSVSQRELWARLRGETSLAAHSREGAADFAPSTPTVADENF